MFIPTLRVVALSLGVLSSPLWGQTFESLYSFPADGLAGKFPEATLTIGPDGNLYGTATEEGPLNAEVNAGTVFRVSLSGQVTILDHFEKTTTGRNPIARMVNIGDGFLYGVTERNGNVAGDPDGTVYRLDLTSGLSPVFQLNSDTSPFPSNPHALVSGEPNVLHVLGYEPGGLWRVPLDGSPAQNVKVFSQTDRVTEGSFHESIIRGSDGLLYGVSSGGGAASSGTIFRIAPDGTGFTRLHSCVEETGTTPVGAMVEGPDGSLYGTMQEGGEHHNGVIFRITRTGEYTVLHHSDDFRYPTGDLLLASDGYLYGTAQDLGTGGNGNGGIFRIKPNGTGYKALYVFEDTNSEPFYPNGRTPIGGLVQGGDGFLYGTTRRGGLGDLGTIFRIDLGLPANRVPIAVDDFGVSTGQAVTVNVKSNDFDPDGDALTVKIESDPTFGTVAVQVGGAIVYTPGDTYNGLDSFEYRITDPRGGSTVATVTIQNVAPGNLLREGTYLGLLSTNEAEGSSPRGQFTLKVDAGGRFTGTIFTQTKRARFRGSFDNNATAAIEVNIPKRGRKVLFLWFKAGQPNTVSAALFDTQLALGTGGPTTDSGSEVKQSYTVQIREDDAEVQLPAGRGYGVLTIKSNGAVTMVGKLGDGTNLSWSSTLTRLPGFAKVISIYDEPMKDGAFAGYIVPAVNGFQGEATWIRPPAKKQSKPYAAGFKGHVDVWIAPFTPPAGGDPVIDLASGSVTLFDGSIPSATFGTFTIDGKKISTEGALRSLTINRKNGLFSGKMLIGKKPLAFKGAINQGSKDGAGFVSVKGVTGAVELFHPVE